MTVGIQILVFMVFLKGANQNYTHSDWIYSMRCPASSLECTDEQDLSPLGFSILVVLVIFSLIPDMINGLRLVHVASVRRSVKSLACGLILICITVLAGVTSYIYNQAIAQSNTEMITNTIVLLVVNDIDERMFTVVSSMFPDWVTRIQGDAAEYADSLIRKPMTREAIREVNRTLYTKVAGENDTGQSHSDYEVLQQRITRLESLYENLRGQFEAMGRRRDDDDVEAMGRGRNDDNVEAMGRGRDDDDDDRSSSTSSIGDSIQRQNEVKQMTRRTSLFEVHHDDSFNDIFDDNCPPPVIG
eukprot:CAMPEP_0172517332 /NCGR_PEP_ID=MMETSP1066-20121228/284354_1 /TAXON_ID=671091 /ORGANISM="Coscinodiscus wailesii, Strain CCMP2513" /LENGTH=300 /DNA_ID=CAMNT_0013299287 /DNA_START=599 /DNA_END=1501 /DNA_ORIENTATION=-